MLKVVGIIILAVLIVAVMSVSASTAYHRYQLGREKESYPPWGEMVEVNGQQLHVYTEGEGEQTLVFLAGHGTSNPTIDFKPLWMRLTDEYKIAVVEKNGYGWSEASKSPRDLDTILDETRQALKAAGVFGPYILVPHSMSGLEAMYWAENYPEEVKAIIGLDSVTPESVKALPKPSKIELYSMYFISRIGLSRFMPEGDVEKNFPILTRDDLTKEEKEEYLALFYRSSLTKPMLGEVRRLQENAEKVEKAGGNEATKETPMLLFISQGQDNEIKDWKDMLSKYVSHMEKGEYIVLNTGHYLHHEKGEIIAENIKEFIRKIEDLSFSLWN